MPLFMIIAGLAALGVAALMVLPMLRGAARRIPGAEADIAVFRDQLAEIDRDMERGTISGAEAEGARTEVSRRLLAAAKRAEQKDGLAPAPRAASRIAAISALVAVPTLAAVIYAQIGMPGLPDQPLASRSDLVRTAETDRPSQEQAEVAAAEAGAVLPSPPVDSQFAGMIEQLRGVLKERPDDVKGTRLLARSLARLGQWVEAREAFDRLAELEGTNMSPDDMALQAETMIFAAGGYVSPRAGDVLARVIARVPNHELARYYAGFAVRQGGRLQAAVGIWEELLVEDLNAPQPRGADWQAALRSLIAETLPDRAAALPGPSSEDIEAAGQLTPEERSAQIQGMVQRLEDRLTSDGGSPEEWVRLINAYTQLDQRDDAKRIFALSQQALTSAEGAGFVRERALLMGLDVE